METDLEEPAEEGAGGAAGDDAPPETPSAKRRFLPSSIGLTVLLPPDVTEIEARVCWGDYRTEPPLSEDLFLPDESAETGEDGKRKKKDRPFVEWVREPKEQTVRIAVPDGRGERRRGSGKCGSAAQQAADSCSKAMPGCSIFPPPTGTSRCARSRSFWSTGARPSTASMRMSGFVFQARLELVCPHGFCPRPDVSGYKATDFDLRVADLHYRDVCEWAVGRNAAAGWDALEDQAGRVTRVWTDPLPQAEVERVAPNEDDELKSRVTFGMEALAERAATRRRSLWRKRFPSCRFLWPMDRGRASKARRSARSSARDSGAPHR